MIPQCTGVQEADFDVNNPEHSYVRQYVGLEDADYLIIDLEQALKNIH